LSSSSPWEFVASSPSVRRPSRLRDVNLAHLECSCENPIHVALLVLFTFTTGDGVVPFPFADSDALAHIMTSLSANLMKGSDG
jgi:hypothetical protein